MIRAKDGTIDISSLAGPDGSPQHKDVQGVGSSWSMFFLLITAKAYFFAILM